MARFDGADATEAGDYYQVCFDCGENDEADYMLLQRQFEFPDGGRCYIETRDLKHIGHFRVASAVFSRTRLFVEWEGRPPAEAIFEASDSEYEEIRRVLQIMIPHLKVE